MIMSVEKKRAQVAAQCKVVAHLASALATVHRDYESLMAEGRMDTLLDDVGRRTASFMEDLGDMLNGMDAVTDEDDWVNPVFEGARQFRESAA